MARKIKGYSPKRRKRNDGAVRKIKSQAKTLSYTLEERRILAVLKKSKGAYASKELLRDSGVKSKVKFYDALHRLANLGDIKVDSKHQVSYVEPEKDTVAELISLSTGFGFARTEDGRDVFIPGRNLKGAFLGDKLTLTGIKDDGKGLFGTVRSITEPGRMLITGTVKTNGKETYIVPDAALRYNLEVQPKDLGGAKDGDKVSAVPKLDRRGDWRYAKIKSIFGDSSSAKICADAIIEAAGIPSIFPAEVISEAETASKMPITEEEIAKRLDLREQPIFTIDGADAKDLDDAIFVEKTESGYKLGVHIADVSHYVKEGSHIDAEAFSRGTSVYFADRVIPMLPEALSNGACSLNAGEDKLTFSALISFDKAGKMTDFDFEKSIINSKVRGIYSEVNELFDGVASKETEKKYEAVMPGLNAARELADILRKKASERGEMEIESDELYFVLDENGKCVDIKPRTTGESQQLIEQMMISANIAAAKFAEKNQLPFVYRTHEAPKHEKIVDLCEVLDRIGISAKPIKTEKPKAEDFQKVLMSAKETTKGGLVSSRVLRTMEKAQYRDEEIGHFGLSLHYYSHFTSPIRRYPDTSIHRIMTDYLNTKDSAKMQKKYEQFAKESASQSSKCEVRAVTAERSAEDCYAAEYAKLHLGEKHVGIISGATSRGIFVKLKSGIEGFVSTNDFGFGAFDFDGLISVTDRATGFTLTVGDELAIVIAASDVATGRIDFMPEDMTKE